ncbi:MAG TPA: hypothetical protein DCR81_07685 [Smithella sp.]|nr:hypothetical protein [Smithella sp.]
MICASGQGDPTFFSISYPLRACSLTRANPSSVSFAGLANTTDEGELFLAGIHPEFQGQGIYLSFLCRAMEWCLSKNAKRIVISAQLNNIAVQKVLTRFGFEISRGYYTYPQMV